MSPTAANVPATIGAGRYVVTAADALTVASATLVATTWKVPKVFGAVYTPELVIDPPVAPSWTDHVTAVLAAPFTVAT
jgi:hypothetical protein